MVHRTSQRSRPLLIGYIAALAAMSVVLGWWDVVRGVPPPGEGSVWTLPVLMGLLVAAEYYYVRFRFGGEINALNLIEALLAPLLFAFDAPTTLVAVATSQLVGGLLRRNRPVKMAFNIAQWTLAAGVGALVLDTISSDGISWGTVLGLLVALGAIGVVNQAAFMTVLAISDQQPVSRLVTTMKPIFPGWLAGLALNALIGLLLVFAYAAHPAGVVLFPVPLIVLYLAYRGYAAARSDKVRLGGVPRAIQTLAAPLDPNDAIETYLAEVAECFEAGATSLILRTQAGRTVARWMSTAGGTFDRFDEQAGSPSLEGALLALPQAARITAEGGGSLGEQLRERGWRECLTAPLLEQGSIVGALVVVDQAGLEGLQAGELAVLESLARETQATLMKGSLVSLMLAERQQLDEIVSSASDGILTVGRDGIVRSWNPALERITGYTARDIVGQPDPFADLRPQTKSGEPIRIERWVDGTGLPVHVEIFDRGGRRRVLSCSYSQAHDGDGTPTALVVVARDMTSERETAELRQRVHRLTEAEAAQHEVVRHLQEALMPAPPKVRGLELGIRYLASDPRAPTGGDLYDCQVLPTGEVHAAVVDVLGHGVSATKGALNVVHTLRTLAVQGCPLEDMIAEADRLLSAQNPDLVATAMIARFEPWTGRVRLASGGHPPALIAGPALGVRSAPAPGGAIGWPGAGTVEVAEVLLDPGDSLILYTDGLVEADKDIIAGEEALMRHARALLDAAAPEMAAGLLDRALGGDRRDDSLVLVLRRAPSEQTASWEIEPRTGDTARTRREATAWLRRHGVGDEAVEDLELMCSELLSNACAVARRKVELRLTLADDRAAIEVQDDGPGHVRLHALGSELPSHDAGAGRGLFIVRSLADDFSALSSDEGSLVRVTKLIEQPSRAPELPVREDRSGSRPAG